MRRLLAPTLFVCASLHAFSADAPKPLECVKNLDALLAALKSTKAKVIVLNMWGITCSPCIAEMPNLTRAAEKFKDNPDVAFVGLCIDEDNSANAKIPEVAAALLAERKVTYLNLCWSGTGDALLDRFKIDGTPYTVILSAGGKDLAEVKIPLDPAKALETLEKSVTTALATVNGAAAK